MFRRFSANFAVTSIFIDLVIIFCSILFSVSYRYELNILPFVKPVFEEVSIPEYLYVIFPVVWVLICLILSVYDGRKNLMFVDELASLTLASLIAGVSLAGLLFLSYRQVSRFLFLLFVILSWLLMILWRAVYRAVYRSIDSSRVQARNVLVIGAGETGNKIRNLILKQRFAGLKFIGFIDETLGNKNEEIIGKMSDLRKVIAEHAVDDVMLALPRSNERDLNQIVSNLHDLPVKVWIIPDYFSLALHKSTFQEFAGIPMIDLRAPALSEYQRIVKRMFDVVISFLSLIVVVPIMAVAAIIIKLDSKGPAFFLQDRMGENGKKFKIIKFRTMFIDRQSIEENSSPFKKSPDDPRVTRVGRFLRRTSIDELPQIFNVIKGDMSLVGPRPEMPQLVDRYEVWQRKRFAVPQGITGWWQINGRSDRPMHQHTEDDLYYVQNYSIWLDIQILFRTFWVVIKGKGAF